MSFRNLDEDIIELNMTYTKPAVDDELSVAHRITFYKVLETNQNSFIESMCSVVTPHLRKINQIIY